VADTLEERSLDPASTVLVSGIGQAAKAPQYLDVHYFNGLHGRALPVATALKASNPNLTVIAESGDGDMYGEGGNHFMHTIRRNPDITLIVHNNMVYGLTKGQASPTSQEGFTTPIQKDGVSLRPFNPLAVALSLGANFVARTFSGHQEEARSILAEAIEHPGFALVDIFQPCVTFNHKNTWKWYQDNTWYLDDSHDPSNLEAALRMSLKEDSYPLGIFYRNRERETFVDTLFPYRKDTTPLHERSRDIQDIDRLYDEIQGRA
jgi:2-oxoglutarate ferredoxin oxidoreductase subunit beta